MEHPAAPVLTRRRRLHRLSCQRFLPEKGKRCEAAATHTCERCLFYCSEHTDHAECCQPMAVAL